MERLQYLSSSQLGSRAGENNDNHASKYCMVKKDDIGRNRASVPGVSASTYEAVKTSMKFSPSTPSTMISPIFPGTTFALRFLIFKFYQHCDIFDVITPSVVLPGDMKSRRGYPVDKP